MSSVSDDEYSPDWSFAAVTPNRSQSLFAIFSRFPIMHQFCGLIIQLQRDFSITLQNYYSKLPNYCSQKRKYCVFSNLRHFPQEKYCEVCLMATHRHVLFSSNSTLCFNSLRFNLFFNKFFSEFFAFLISLFKFLIRIFFYSCKPFNLFLYI